MNLDQQLNGNQSRRMAAQNRYLDRIEKRETEVDCMIGELCREGKTVYYINLRNSKGAMTGKTKESASRYELTDYLICNNY